MKLNEFFSPPADEQSDKDPRDVMSGQSDEDQDKLADEVYWYMLDDDNLHKEYFIPLAYDIKALQKADKFNHNEFVNKWLPLVNAACTKFYKENKEELPGDPADLFSLDMRKMLCQRLSDQHHTDIENDEYKVG
jgi:hypothetical protein